MRTAAVTGIAALIILLAPTPAHASDESALLSLTNQVRASRGLPALSIDPQLSAVAQRWAATLAERGVISHNSSLPGQVTGWKVLGENVGLGGTVQAVHDAWVASSTHYKNLVDPVFIKVGFGIVRPDARIFIVQVFMQPKSTVVTTSPAVQEPRVAAAAPAPAPSAPTTRAAPVVSATVPGIPAEALPSLDWVLAMRPW